MMNVVPAALMPSARRDWNSYDPRTWWRTHASRAPPTLALVQVQSYYPNDGWLSGVRPVQRTMRA